MHSLAIARGLYEEAAKEAEGREANELARTLEQKALQLHLQRREVATDVMAVSPLLRSPAETASALQGDTREELREVMEDQGQEGAFTAGDADQVSEHLKNAGEDLRETLGKRRTRVEELEAHVAGQARLGQEGSDVFDPEAIEGTTGRIIDRDMAKGVAAHEEFHTMQKQPDAERVVLEDGTEVTAHDFIEAGAIAEQKRNAPRSRDRLSAEYKAIDDKMGGLLPQADLLELSREGKLQEFARRVDEGTPLVQAA